MVNDNQPFVMAEDIGFLRLMSHVASRYKVLSRFHFSDKVIPDMARKVENTVEQMIADCQWLSFTSDIWTCQHTNESYISMTAHWVDESTAENPRQYVVLHSGHFPVACQPIFATSLLTDALWPPLMRVNFVSSSILCLETSGALLFR